MTFMTFMTRTLTSSGERSCDIRVKGGTMVTGRQDRQRHLSTNAELRLRKGQGLRAIEFLGDPTDVVDFLHEAGIFTPDADPKTLGDCMTLLVDQWREGAIRVTRCREGS